MTRGVVVGGAVVEDVLDPIPQPKSDMQKKVPATRYAVRSLEISSSKGHSVVLKSLEKTNTADTIP